MTVLSMILAAVVALVLAIALGYLALLGAFFVSPEEL